VTAPVSSTLSPEIAHAQEVTQVVDVDELIKTAAQNEHINYGTFYKTLSCESGNFQDVAIQSQVPDPTGPNGKEDSWGAAQINIPSHPEITREQAQDPTFAIPWAAKEYAKNPHTFHCYDIEVKNGWK